LEAEDEPEDGRVIIIDHSPESEKSEGMELVDDGDDVMVLDGEEVVVLGECEVLEAEFDISNCDVMELETLEDEEPTPQPKQQIIVRHTKKGKQIVMVKRGEEGKDQRHVVYRTNSNENEESGENSKSPDLQPQPGPSRVPTPRTTAQLSRTSTPIPTALDPVPTPVSPPSRPASVPAAPIRSPPSTPVRVSPSPTTSSPMLSRLVSSPVRSVPSPTITPPPAKLTVSPSSTAIRLVAPLVRLSTPMPLPTTTVHQVPSHVRLLTPSPVPTLPSKTTSTLRLVTQSCATTSSAPILMPTSSPNKITPNAVPLLTKAPLTAVKTSVTAQPPPRLVSAPRAVGPRAASPIAVGPRMPPMTPIIHQRPPSAISKPLVSMPPLIRPVTSSAPSSTVVTSGGVSLTQRLMTMGGPSVIMPSSQTPVVSAPNMAALLASPSVISVAPADSPSEQLPKDDSKPVIPTLSFPDFPEGLASKFMSAECSVIKKSEVTETTPIIRAAKTYEKARHGKQKVQLSEHDYTSSQKPPKSHLDETDITSHIAKIDPKVRDIISISKITQDTKKIDRRKSMETISKRKAIDERRRSSENKRELEQRRLMILEEIQQDKDNKLANISATSSGPPGPQQPTSTAPATSSTLSEPAFPHSSDANIKQEHDLSDVIDILENIDSTTPTRLLSSSELQNMEKTTLFENEEFDKSPVKAKPNDKINIQSLLNESGQSDLQMSDLARGTGKATTPEQRPPQPPANNQSKLAALLTGGKVPTLESLLEKDQEQEEKKQEVVPEQIREPTPPPAVTQFASSPINTSGPVRISSAPPTPIPQSPSERVAEIQRELMAGQIHQMDNFRQSASVAQSNPRLVPTSTLASTPGAILSPVATISPMPQPQIQHQLLQQAPSHFTFHQVIQHPSTTQEQQFQLQQASPIQAPQQMHPASTLAPRFHLVSTSQRLSVPTAVMTTAVHPSRMDESQNVLLKQLLQNTGCAPGGASSPGLPRSPTPSTPSPITSPTIKKEVMDSTEIKTESAEELKKLKRRQYQQKRRQSQGKEVGTPKKRARKGSRMEEDYETYVEGLMSQLKQLPPLSVMEPSLQQNLTVCPPFGWSDSPLPMADFYSIQPFGLKNKPRVKSPVTTQRGFYDQVS